MRLPDGADSFEWISSRHGLSIVCHGPNGAVWLLPVELSPAEMKVLGLHLTAVSSRVRNDEDATRVLGVRGSSVWARGDALFASVVLPNGVRAEVAVTIGESQAGELGHALLKSATWSAAPPFKTSASA